jgi:hypothetical protein
MSGYYGKPSDSDCLGWVGAVGAVGARVLARAISYLSSRVLKYTWLARASSRVPCYFFLARLAHASSRVL